MKVYYKPQKSAGEDLEENIWDLVHICLYVFKQQIYVLATLLDGIVRLLEHSVAWVILHVVKKV